MTGCHEAETEDQVRPMLTRRMMTGMVVVRAMHAMNRPLEEGGLLAEVVQVMAYLGTWGGRWAVDVGDEWMQNKNNVVQTYQSATECVMDLVHGSVERVEFGACFAALLQLSLEAAQDDIETETRLSWWAHAAHPTQTLLSELRSPLCRKREILWAASHTSNPDSPSDNASIYDASRRATRSAQR